MFKKVKHTILGAVIFFIIAQCIFILPHATSVYAADYSINYGISYTINPDGVATVDYHIQLTNLSDTLYVTSESLTTTQTDIYNLNVINSLGISQKFTVTKTSNTATITTTFSNPAVGQGSSDDWHIVYNTKQIASNIGHTWNILVPGFGDRGSLNINNLQIAITVPKNFGNINFASPAPSKTQDNGNNLTYVYQSDKIDASGINLILGDAETYKFTFNYPITNTDSNTQVYTIAVPPDTPLQSTTFTNISPQPDTFTINSDGDYILTYKLPSKKSGTIHVEGISIVYATNGLLQKKRTTPIQLSSSDQQTYTQAMKYWDVNNPQVQVLSQKLTANLTNNTDKARAIYDYLVKNFTYNRSALFDKNRQRKGSLYALAHPKDVICQEYVDTFVALARAAHIPAVMEAGYGNTLSPLDTLPDNVLHAWALYYDPDYGWVPVDPTWGSTSGENFFGNIGSSHYALAAYGHSSTDPILVLAFIANSDSSNNIKLLPTNESYVSNPGYSLASGNTVSVNGGFASNGIVSMTNSGNRVLYLDYANLSGVAGNPSLNPFLTDAYIFPGMNGNIGFNVTSNLFNSQKIEGLLSVAYKGYGDNIPVKKEYPLSIIITPGWYVKLIPLLAVILIFVLSYTLVNLVIRLRGRFAKN